MHDAGSMVYVSNGRSAGQASEASRLAAPAAVLSLGGDESLLQQLTAAGPPAELVVFEPDEARQEIVAGWFGDYDGSIECIVLSTPGELDEWLNRNVVHNRDVSLSIHMTGEQRETRPKAVRMFEGMIAGANVRRAVADKTMREKGGVFLNNLAANIGQVLPRPYLTSIEGAGQNCPGYIVGSGPGLAVNGSALVQAARTGFIIAASSALKPLLQLGVTPDMVVVVEAEDTSDYLAPLKDCPETILAVASAAHPGHFTHAGEQTVVFHVTQGAAGVCGAEGILPQAGQAGTAAFTAGLVLGFNPLVLVGQDQAVDGDRLHAPGTPGDSSPTTDMYAFRVRGLGDNPVATHSGFAASLHWYAESVRYLTRRNPGVKVFNATESGAHIAGVKDIRLADVAGWAAGKNMRSPSRDAVSGMLPRADAAAARRHLRQTWEITAALSEIIRLAPDQAWPALEDCRRSHHFLDEAFYHLDASSTAREIIDAVRNAEALVLGMVEELGPS